MTLLQDAVLASWSAYYEQGLDPTSPHPETLGYTNVTWLPGKRGFTGVKDGVFTVAVAGTRSITDFITDIRAVRVKATSLFGTKVQVAGGSMEVHAGFWADTNEIAQAILDAYKAASARNASLTVLFTGHSLGAAIAAVISRFWPFSPFSLIHFGMPRAGDWRFVFSPTLATCSIRVRHARDAVPCLPAGCGYEHHEKLLHLDDKGKVRWWVRLARWLTRDLPLLSDHPIHKYAAVVKAYEAP